MLSADDNKPIGKPGQRARKKKAGQRAKAGEEHATVAAQSPDTAAELSQEVDQETNLETSADISVRVPSIETLPAEAASAPVISTELVPVSTRMSPLRPIDTGMSTRIRSRRSFVASAPVGVATDSGAT